MKAYILFGYSILFILNTVKSQQTMDNCDNVFTSTTGSGKTCYYCDGHSWDSSVIEGECFSCSTLWELDCDTCSCRVSTSGYALSISFWVLICMCCGICIYSCRKGYCCRDCCYPNGMPVNNEGSFQKPLNPSARPPLPDSRTQFTKCKFCGNLERPGCLRCSKCNTSMASMSNIRVGLQANDKSVSENSLPSQSQPNDFIKCEACNRFQFAGSNGGDGTCFYCNQPLPQKKEVISVGVGIEKVLEDEQIQCQGCNEIISKKHKFCSNCGKKVELENEQRCVSCNEIFDKTGKFCPNCGSKAETLY